MENHNHPAPLPGGWIKLYRSLTRHWLWQEKPFSKGQAWLDLLLLAGFQPRKIPMGQRILQLEAGELLISEASLMERWGWGKSRLRSFLKLLEEDGMLQRKPDGKRTVFFLTGYRDFQACQTDAEPMPNHSQTDAEPLPNRYKNNKKYKTAKDAPPLSPDADDWGKPKKDFAAYVRLSEREYDELCGLYGADDVSRMIELLDHYKGQSGTVYRSDYHAIRHWVAGRVLEKQKREASASYPEAEEAQSMAAYSWDLAEEILRRDNADIDST